MWMGSRSQKKSAALAWKCQVLSWLAWFPVVRKVTIPRRPLGGALMTWNLLTAFLFVCVIRIGGKEQETSKKIKRDKEWAVHPGRRAARAQLRILEPLGAVHCGSIERLL